MKKCLFVVLPDNLKLLLAKLLDCLKLLLATHLDNKVQMGDNSSTNYPLLHSIKTKKSGEINTWHGAESFLHSKQKCAEGAICTSTKIVWLNWLSS